MSQCLRKYRVLLCLNNVQGHGQVGLAAQKLLTYDVGRVTLISLCLVNSLKCLLSLLNISVSTLFYCYSLVFVFLLVKLKTAN